jgi:hypothetical protein
MASNSATSHDGSAASQGRQPSLACVRTYGQIADAPQELNGNLGDDD